MVAGMRITVNSAYSRYSKYCNSRDRFAYMGMATQQKRSLTHLLYKNWFKAFCKQRSLEPFYFPFLPDTSVL